MRTSLQSSKARESQGTAYATHTSAPTGGWNTRDSVVGMDSRDALVLDNWFPQASEVWQRGGSASFATGMTGTVKTLVEYNSAAGVKKLIAFTDAGAYDVTAGGVIGGLMAGSAFTNGYVNTLLMTNSAGNSFLWACNGIDTPMVYNGVNWAALAITGLTPANIQQAWIFKHRIWFIEKNTMNVYYLPIDSIQGAAQVYPMGNLFRLGGSLIAGTNWTLDGGDGPDDALVLVSSEGEMAVFQGTDPNSASSWGLSGMFVIGRPCGNRCFFKLGGDVGFIAETGVFPLSRALQLGSINFSAALTNKIQPSITAASGVGGITTQGWEGTVYPKYNALIVNLPNQVFGVAIQFVMNTITGQWCSFSGWDARCFHVYNGTLYFGGLSGVVYKAWDGVLTADGTADITSTAFLAYQYFGTSAVMKQIKLLRFLLSYDGRLDVRWTVAPDYQESATTSLYPRSAGRQPAVWNVADWNIADWALDISRSKQWKSVSHAPGYALSLRLAVTGNDNSQVRWAGTDFLLDRAGLM